MHRRALALAIGLVLVGSSPLAAQDDTPPRAAPPSAQDALAPPPKPPLTPPQLIDKSVRDLAKGKLGAVVQDDVKALRRGPLLIHGNYCGIGNRPGTVPVDALDAACERHDACTHTDKLPSCACDNRLREEANEIAQDPAAPADIKALAVAMVGSMTVLICK